MEPGVPISRKMGWDTTLQTATVATEKLRTLPVALPIRFSIMTDFPIHAETPMRGRYLPGNTHSIVDTRSDIQRRGSDTGAAAW